jgi:hypothetical protein
MTISKKKLLLSASAVLLGTLASAYYLFHSNPRPSSANFMSVESGSSFQEVEKAFVNFVARHKRAYATKEEHSRRFANFRATFDMVARHNAKEGVTSRLEINKFADMADDDFRRPKGSLLPEDYETIEKINPQSLDIMDNTPAYSVDWSATV